eukprot:305166-Chlamydomonas_euryale.AAC.1
MKRRRTMEDSNNNKGVKCALGLLLKRQIVPEATTLGNDRMLKEQPKSAFHALSVIVGVLQGAAPLL